MSYKTGFSGVLADNLFKWLEMETASMGGGNTAPWLANFLTDPAALGLNTTIPKIFQRKKLSMLLRLINWAALWKVANDLKTLIKDI